MQLQRGIARLAERAYPEAAAAFAGAAGHPHAPSRKQAFRLRVYALCMAGRCEEGEALARARYAAVSPRALPPFWTWMQGRFALDLRAPEIAGAR